MIEKTIREYLADRLSVPVYLEIPANPPESFVLIEKTGSNVVNMILKATFAIQSYGSSLFTAASLHEMVKHHMKYLDTIMNISKSELNSDYNYTDTTSKRHRYQAVYEVTYYDKED